MFGRLVIVDTLVHVHDKKCTRKRYLVPYLGSRDRHPLQAVEMSCIDILLAGLERYY